MPKRCPDRWADAPRQDGTRLAAARIWGERRAFLSQTSSVLALGVIPASPEGGRFGPVSRRRPTGSGTLNADGEARRGSSVSHKSDPSSESFSWSSIVKVQSGYLSGLRLAIGGVGTERIHGVENRLSTRKTQQCS